MLYLDVDCPSHTSVRGQIPCHYLNMPVSMRIPEHILMHCIVHSCIEVHLVYRQ